MSVLKSPQVFGLVIPTRWEAQPILRRFRFKSQGDGLYGADRSGKKLLALVSGMGRVRAAQASGRLVQEGARELLSVGFCGALVPECKVGDLVTERIITVDTPARTPAERDALTQRANAVAVDMETRAIVETGTRLGVPIRVLRVVSDAYHDDLTPLLGREASFSEFSVALRLFNPRLWPLVMKLKRQSHFASQRLIAALEAFFQAR